jgi:long-chain fatty acid transport protein
LVANHKVRNHLLNREIQSLNNDEPAARRAAMGWGRNWSRTVTILIACTSSDHLFAGGWDRFDQGIDLLFDPGKVTFDVRLYELIPNRKFNTVNGKPESVSTTSDIFRPSLNAKFVPFDNAACLAAYRQPFGIDNRYPPTWSQASVIVSSSLKVQELGLTCSYRVPAGDGYLRLIGGVTEDFGTYHQEALRQLPNGSSIRPTLDLETSAPGWRAGVAYEMPAKGVRASLMYYSNIDFSAHGTLRQLPLRGNAFLNAVPTQAATAIPPAVEGVIQLPIAPSWFDTITVKWVDWSAVTSIPIILAADSGPFRAGQVLSTLNAFWRDGWTIGNTVTYRWNDRLALSLNVGWDRGVSTGWTDNPDAWNTLLFANYKLNEHVEVTGGVGLVILMPGEINKMAQGGSFNATAGTGNIVFTHLGLRYRF